MARFPIVFLGKVRFPSYLGGSLAPTAGMVARGRRMFGDLSRVKLPGATGVVISCD